MAPAQLPVFRSFLLRQLRDDPSLGRRQLLPMLKQQWDVSVGERSFQDYIADLKQQIASGADRDYAIVTSEDDFRIHYMHLRCIMSASLDMPLADILQKLREDYQIDMAMPLLTQVVLHPVGANIMCLDLIFSWQYKKQLCVFNFAF